jgi:hypothetical protein
MDRGLSINTEAKHNELSSNVEQLRFSVMTYMKRKEIFVVILCLIIGFALRFYTFDKKSLWVDEVYTFNDSRDDLSGQMKFYEKNPTYLHPPLFFVLTHLFYPFEKPERDLRIIPLIFGIFSIPMIYFLSRLFSPGIALPCTLSLTFMTYHVSLSQEGRSYTLIMFLGMAGLYFFLKYLKTPRKIYLPLAAIFFGILFYISYSSISFIVLSQVLWLYRAGGNSKKPRLPSFLFLNGLIFLICLPWILFVASHYKFQPWMDPFQGKVALSLSSILYWIFHDWTLHLPLMIFSITLLILLPVFSSEKRNALLLLLLMLLPVTGGYLFCELTGINHFFSSRYFINFLPLLFISLYLSLSNIEVRFERLRRYIRPSLLFLIFFIASNLIILPLYYKSEKLNLRGLVNYLKGELKEGDKIFDSAPGLGFSPGILHYFGTFPASRHYIFTARMISQNEIDYAKSFTYGDKQFTIYHSSSCCNQYVNDGSRIWMITNKQMGGRLKAYPQFVLKGFFDASFLNYERFPYDASIYLFLLDPRSPGEKGIDLPTE